MPPCDAGAPKFVRMDTWSSDKRARQTKRRKFLQTNACVNCEKKMENKREEKLHAAAKAFHPHHATTTIITVFRSVDFGNALQKMCQRYSTRVSDLWVWMQRRRSRQCHVMSTFVEMSSQYFSQSKREEVVSLYRDTAIKIECARKRLTRQRKFQYHFDGHTECGCQSTVCNQTTTTTNACFARPKWKRNKSNLWVKQREP